MRAGYNEALAMLGYVLGMAATSVLIEWARESDRESLTEVLLICSVLFEVAFLFGLVRLLLRGLRWAGRLFARRRRLTVSQDPPGFPGH
jgi:F0F1-type ATP synthase membrane subunit c/vacuolar-type H+-ATPase subunit K